MANLDRSKINSLANQFLADRPRIGTRFLAPTTVYSRPRGHIVTPRCPPRARKVVAMRTPQSRMICFAMLLGTMSASLPAADSTEALLTKARQVLAQLDGEIRAAGLKEPVEVLRDTWGVPHIYARN